MLGSELKKIRKKAQLTQKKFAKKLYINQALLSQMENGDIPVSPKVEKALEKNIRKEYTVLKTNKVFSRDKFLLNMLTGNTLVDDLYLNANWLNDLDNKKVSLKKTKIFIEDDKGNELGVLGVTLEYIIDLNVIFYVKKEWLK